MWRLQTLLDILKALEHNPDWLVVILELFGVIYMINLLVRLNQKAKRAIWEIKFILGFLILSGIIYLLWNYLYIDGVNPFTHAVLPIAPNIPV